MKWVMSVKDDIAQVPAILKSLRVDSEAARMLEAIPLYVLIVIHEGAIGIPTSIAHRIFNNATAGGHLLVYRSQIDRLRRTKKKSRDGLPLFRRSTNEPTRQTIKCKRRITAQPCGYIIVIRSFLRKLF